MKKIGILFILILLITSCTKKKSFQRNVSIKDDETERIINQYRGRWHCISSDDFQEIIDLGLVLELGIYVDGKMKISAVVGAEEELLNTGTWTLSPEMDKLNFVLPDQEYGGSIYGILQLKCNSLYYILDEYPEQKSIFKKY
jgi:hypothetical protein